MRVTTDRASRPRRPAALYPHRARVPRPTTTVSIDDDLDDDDDDVDARTNDERVTHRPSIARRRLAPTESNECVESNRTPTVEVEGRRWGCRKMTDDGWVTTTRVCDATCARRCRWE